MKIAFTADVHLTTKSKNPERFQALGNIFKQCQEKDVQLLVIAGDLFDKDLPNYADFEELVRTHRAEDLVVVITPGNHDHKLSQGALLGEGLQVYSDPTLQPLNDSRKILFLPYQENRTMGELIAPFAEELQDQRWVLVSHGDWTAGLNTPDPYEKGLYFPLTRTDMDIYQPELVFLGHIHLAQKDQSLYYPGSPCPMDISETGLRQFLILDTEKGEVNTHLVDSPVVYFNERFVMLPSEEGLDQLQEEIAQRIAKWDLPDGWENKIQVRVNISGTSNVDRDMILKEVKNAFSKYSFYNDEGPHLAGLVHNIDPDRIEISNKIKDWIDDLDWPSNPGSPTKLEILDQALKVIHGEK